MLFVDQTTIVVQHLTVSATLSASANMQAHLGSQGEW